MKIIKFYAKWCSKCNLFMDKKDLGYESEIDIDLPSNAKILVKYQISIIPTFIALNDRGRIRGKLSNPIDVEEYKSWKERVSRKR